MNYDAIRDALNKETFTYDDDLKSYVRQIYIGTVFSWVPSGKYYAPWSTNVTEAEVEKDQAWFDTVTEDLAKRGLFLTSGEGDPCDLFVGESKDDIDE